MTTTLPKHFMVSECDGGLYDTRKQDWAKQPLRAGYQGGKRDIGSTSDLKACLRQAYVWPGGYELVYMTDDGALLCGECVRKKLRAVLWSVRHESNDGWRVVACGYEATSADIARKCDEELVSYCAHCNKEFGEIA